MIRRLATAVLCTAALALALAPRAARASAADAFENKVKPVSGQLYQKAGKLELTVPVALLSVNDAFFSKYMAGARLGYHFNEYLSLGAGGAIGATRATGSTSVCPGDQGCHAATEAQLQQVPGNIRWTAALDLAFSPIYGKLNVFAEKAIHFDLSLLGGPDLVGYRQLLPADRIAAGAQPGNATALGGHLGVGARVFLARFAALRFELRDVVYSVPRIATAGGVQTQLFVEGGLSFFVPVAQRDAT